MATTEEVIDFIEQIAPIVQRVGRKYGVLVSSPIIAQACLESAYGTSYKGKFYHNYFGLKYKPGRVSCNNGVFNDGGSEQLADGSYVPIATDWYAFADMEHGVEGYFQFLNIDRYANLKGETNARAYLEKIKADGYATSLNYVDNVWKVVEKYNLTRFDMEVKSEMKTVIIDAGHGLHTAGKRCLKSLDQNETREWTLNSRIADMVCKTLEAYDVKVIRVDDVTGAVDVPLATRVSTANNANADVYVSIHHNAGLNGKPGGGTVCYYNSSKAERQTQCQAFYDAVVSRTGLVGNRSSKVINKAFYVLKNTKMPAFLIENGFMDSPDDVPVILTEAHAKKTADGVVAFLEAKFGIQRKTSAPVQPAKLTITIPQCAEPVLHKGDKNVEVRLLQADLNYCIDKGVIKAEKLDTDGSFGSKTWTVLKLWQKTVGISSDGSYGPTSAKTMKKYLV